MFTKEQFESIRRERIIDPSRILIRSQAIERANRTGTLVTVFTMDDDSIFFYTNDHCFGYPLLPQKYVSCTEQFPMFVKPRPELPDGVVDTLEKFEMIFHKEDRHIDTLEELIMHLNETH